MTSKGFFIFLCLGITPLIGGYLYAGWVGYNSKGAAIPWNPLGFMTGLEMILLFSSTLLAGAYLLWKMEVRPKK